MRIRLPLPALYPWPNKQAPYLVESEVREERTIEVTHRTRRLHRAGHPRRRFRIFERGAADASLVKGLTFGPRRTS